jgi:hypothetical protein
VSLQEMVMLAEAKVVSIDQLNALLKYDHDRSRSISYPEFLHFIFEAVIL